MSARRLAALAAARGRRRRRRRAPAPRRASAARPPRRAARVPSAETPNVAGLAAAARGWTERAERSRRTRSYAELAGALASRRRRVRDPVAGARGDQQDRDELRRQHGPELGRRGRLDAVHARHVAALGARRRAATASPTRGTRRTRSTPRRATSPRRAAPTDLRARDLRLQPRRLVRPGRARAGRGLRGRRGPSVELRCRPASSEDRAGGGASSRRSEALTPRVRTERRLAPVEGSSSPRGRARCLLSDELALRRGGRRSPATRRAAAAAASRRSRLGLGEAERALADAAALAAASFARRGRRCWPRRLRGRLRLPGRRRADGRLRRAPHHDYPAADIAAPEGAPVYALADARRRALVARRRALRDRRDDPDRRRPELDVLPPLVPRPARRAGAGARPPARSSASSARPGTRPARTSTSSSSRRRSYPQEQDWFQSFAGTAFTWQGGGSDPSAAALPSPAAVSAGRSSPRSPATTTSSSRSPASGGRPAVAFCRWAEHASRLPAVLPRVRRASPFAACSRPRR